MIRRIRHRSAARWGFGLLLAGGSAFAQNHVISTYAGGGIPPVTQIPALQAKLNEAENTAADADGNVYFTASNAVFRLDTSGAVTRIAGNGYPGFSGDGGPATMARLDISVPGYLYAVGLGADGAGNVYLGDTANRRVRRISPDGTIVTVAGNGSSGTAGDGGPAVEAQIGQPSSLAIDRSGNLFFADIDHGVVREVSAAGIIRTVAGNGAPGSGTSGRLLPAAIAVDAEGNLFIADAPNHRILKVSPDGTITTAPGAAQIAWTWPSSLAADASGNLFIADYNSAAIQRLAPDGTLTVVAGNGTPGFSGDGGPATKAQVFEPWSVAVDAQNNLFFTDYGNQRIRKVAASGTITTAAGGGSIDPLALNGVSATGVQLLLNLAGLQFCCGLASDGNGNVFFAETAKGLIRKVAPAGTIATVAGGGSCAPPDCVGDGKPATNAFLYNPTAVALDGNGNLYIADEGNLRVRKVSPDGTITTVAGNGTLGNSGDGGPATAAALDPQSIAVDGQGNLFINASGPVRKVTPDGTITTVAGGGDCAGPACDGRPATDVFVTAAAVAVDGSGNLLIADDNEDDSGCYFYLRKVSPSGIISTLAGKPGPCGPSGDGGPAVGAALGVVSGIAVDVTGNIFLAQLYDQIVRRISPDGNITTVAGGLMGYSGDGGLAVGAGVSAPNAVAFDGAGNVFFSDTNNEVIRVLRPAKFPLIGAVVDAASQAAGPVTAGKVVVIYGGGLGPPSLARNQPGALPGGGTGYGPGVANASVTFNSIPAPILYASATQVAAVVPYEGSGTTAQVQVTYQGSASNTFQIPVAAASPSLFTRNQSGSGQAAAMNTADWQPNTSANPARIGDFVTLYATGEGQTVPAGVDGKLVDSTSIHPALPVTVTVGGIPAFVQYAGGAPGQVAGVLQVNVQIPAGVQPGGYVPVVLQVGNAPTNPDAVWIAVSGR